MRLDKTQIQFIDNYLNNSDIAYLDIRMEMVDHVASGIEAEIDAGDQRDFYEIFKEYMIKNKARLLNDNKHFLKSTDKKIIKLLFKNSLTIHGIAVLALVFFGFLSLFKYYDQELFKGILLAIPFITMIILGLIYFIALKVYDLERFSLVERIAFPFVAIFHIFSFIGNVIIKPSTNSNIMIYLILLVSIVLTLLFMLLKITIRMAKMYRNRYKGLV